MKIAFVSEHNGTKDFLLGFNGKPVEFSSKADAEQQIALLKQTGGWNYKKSCPATEPENFVYVIE